MDTRAQEILEFWLNEIGPDRWYRPDPAIELDDSRALVAALGDRSRRRLARVVVLVRSGASRFSCCSTSSRATCSATTRAPSPATRGR